MDKIFFDIEPYVFWVLAGLTAGSAVMTLVTQNIVRAATWLLFTLGGTAGVFFLLGADFVGATQLLVYVGGTLILVVFGVMLTAQGPFITMKASAAEWALSLAVGIALYAVLALSTLYPYIRHVAAEGHHGAEAHAATGHGEKKPKETSPLVKEIERSRPEVVKKYAPQKNLSEDPAEAPYAAILGMGFLNRGVGPAHQNTEGEIVRTAYLLPFEIVSVHLLVVLIGAAYLARAKRKRAP